MANLLLNSLPKETRQELWLRGDLRHLTRPGPQRELYDVIKNRDKSFAAFSPYVLNFHRRLGKTFLGVLLSIEACVRRPGVWAKFMAPSSTQAQDIIEEHWGIILSDAPDCLIPKGWRGEKFTFRNPRWEGTGQFDKSILRLYGVNNDRGNKARGGSTDICVFDECREMEDLNYTWTSVLLPTFKGREEPLCMMFSTPPDTCDHPFISKFLEAARDCKRYFCVPGSEDPNWTEEEDEMMAREMGGRNSAEYQREIECKIISDSSKLIIPEFVEGDSEDGANNFFLHEDRPRPEYYNAYTLADCGAVDSTGITFAYVDFIEKKIVVEDELMFADESTQEVTLRWRSKTHQVFNKELEEKEGRHIVDLDHWADTTVQQQVDMARVHHFSVHLCSRDDKEASRNYLRHLFRTGRISINRNCRELIFQLRNGTRTPRGEFVRTERMGHCDLVASLIRLARVVDLEENPYPRPIHDRETYFVPPGERAKKRGWGQYFRKPRPNYTKKASSW